MKKITFNQYFGKISVRVFDTKLKKNIAAIDLFELEKYLTAKLKSGEFPIPPKPKGNTLPVIKLK